MSQLERIKENTQKKQKNGSTQKSPAKKIFTVYLTGEQKSALLKKGWTYSEIFDSLEEQWARGHKITIGQDLDRGVFYVILRETKEVWTEARAVSAMHAVPERALATLWYYLTEVNPEWPENVRTASYDDLSW